MEWRGREWSGGEGREGGGRAGQGRVPECLGGLSRVGISSRSTRPWNGQPPSTLLKKCKGADNDLYCVYFKSSPNLGGPLLQTVGDGQL